jgi:phosphatidylglycerol---prolipoprotein diacylglyceryl transferase
MDIQFGYAAMVLLGISILVFFQPAAQFDSSQKHEYYRLQAITFIGAILGSKLAVVIGDGLWPMQPFNNWAELLFSGRSIVGALLFGFLVAEACKPLLKYQLPPNDRFALIVPFSIASGRIGCWLAGCCPGLPMDEPFGVAGAGGITRFPAALVEMAFHLAAGFTLIFLWKKRRFSGRLFALYLVAYGAFRFLTEYWRFTDKAFAGLSAYQWLCFGLVMAGATALYFRRESQRKDYGRRSA